MTAPLPPSASAAGAWAVRLFDERDHASAWELVDPDLQLARIQGWLFSIGELDGQQTADEIAAASVAHPRWDEFERINTDRWTAALGDLFAEPWGVLDKIEPVGIDLELVALMPAVGELGPGEAAYAQIVVMRLREGQWRVAGVGRTIAVPGWPPTEEQVREPWA